MRKGRRVEEGSRNDPYSARVLGLLSLSLLCTQQLDVEEAFSWRDAANSKQFLGVSKLQDIPYLLQKNVISSLMCVNMFGS